MRVSHKSKAIIKEILLTVSTQSAIWFDGKSKYAGIMCQVFSIHYFNQSSVIALQEHRWNSILLYIIHTSLILLYLYIANRLSLTFIMQFQNIHTLDVCACEREPFLNTIFITSDIQPIFSQTQFIDRNAKFIVKQTAW